VPWPWPTRTAGRCLGTVILVIGAGGGVLGNQLAPRVGLVLGGLATLVAGWGCGFGPAATLLPGGGERRGSDALPICWVRWSGMGGRSCTIWASLVAAPILIIW
jgi:hypothetical protein